MTTIYRDFDQAALDAEYNLRAAVAEHPAYFARWARDSAAVRATHAFRLDLPYGERPRERLDVFLPAAGLAPAPLLVFFHGGYWQAMDKSDFSVIAPGFLAAGIAVALVNYTLAPAGSVALMVEEARAAVAWLRREAEALGIDCARVGVCGHSAGGHLTAMTMLAAWPDMGLPAPRVFCPVSGVFDLEPIRLCYLNRVLGLDAAMAAATSPQRLIEAGTSLPRTRLILAVGGRETAEFRRQQADFAAACAARGLAPQIVAQDEDHHFSIIDRLAEPQSRLHQALAASLTQS